MKTAGRGTGTHGDAGVLGEQLGGDAAQSSEHGPPGVDHLDLAIPVTMANLSVLPPCRLPTAILGRHRDYRAFT